MKILIVEDNKESRYLLEKLLQGCGHEITAATNGTEALEQALAQPPDMIVSDILMPKMDGFQLCHECKQNEQLKNIPFVFYTATYTLDEDKKFAMSLGVDAFILKPTEPDILIQMLSELFEKAKSGALAQPEVAGHVGLGCSHGSQDRQEAEENTGNYHDCHSAAERGVQISQHENCWLPGQAIRC